MIELIVQFTLSIHDTAYVMFFYNISLMCPDMDLELSIHKETAYSDGSFHTEISQISTFFNFS